MKEIKWPPWPIGLVASAAVPVEAARAGSSSQSFCRLWIDHWSTCLEKSEWASWAQAVGTVAAMPVSPVLVYWQVHKQHRLHREHLEAIARREEIEEIVGYTTVIEIAHAVLMQAHAAVVSGDDVRPYQIDGPSTTLLDYAEEGLSSFDRTKLASAVLILEHIAALHEFRAARQALRIAMEQPATRLREASQRGLPAAASDCRTDAGVGGSAALPCAAAGQCVAYCPPDQLP